MANTTNYNLNKPIRWTEDWDSLIDDNFDDIDAELHNHSNSITTLTNKQNEMGTIANLNTSIKDNLVNSINEVVANYPLNSVYRQAIINGNFDIWQRGTSFTNPSSYTSDRWGVVFDGSMSRTVSLQYANGVGSDNLIHNVFQSSVASASGQTYNAIYQKVENVTRFYGNWTASFWVYSSVAYNLTTRVDQNFGSGGSSTVQGTTSTTAISANTWTKVTATFNLASCIGKTIGSNHCLVLYIFMPINAAHTFQLSQAQLNAGSNALPFMQKRYSEELRSCMRYYQYGLYNLKASGTTSLYCLNSTLQVPMRTSSWIISKFGSDVETMSNSFLYDNDTAGNTNAVSWISKSATEKWLNGLTSSSSAFTIGHVYSTYMCLDNEL